MTSDPPLRKADFGAIYDQPDPRAYFTTLEPFDYAIPGHGAEIVHRLLKGRARQGTDRPRVLDVCCSYGVVATLLKTDLALADVYAHYRDASDRALTSAHLVDVDRRLLHEHRRSDSPTVVGLDVAGNAVRYALATGALDDGISENLEVDEPSTALTQMLSRLDVVVTTGGVGYVTERTFDRLLRYAPDTVWVATFCLRTYDYGPIARTLHEHGLQTERLPQTFRQRRFTGPEEREWALEQLRERGIDPTGRETDGCYHADFYLSRPAVEVDAQPLERLLPGHGAAPT